MTDRQKSFVHRHFSTILVFAALVIVFIGTAVALNVGYEARDTVKAETLARKVGVATAVCKAGNEQSERFLKFVRGIANGANTAAAPIPSDLPASVIRFLETSRSVNRAYYVRTLIDAERTFKVVDCK